MKKFVIFLVSVLLILALCGCSVTIQRPDDMSQINGTANQGDTNKDFSNDNESLKSETSDISNSEFNTSQDEQTLFEDTASKGDGMNTSSSNNSNNNISSKNASQTESIPQISYTETEKVKYTPVSVTLTLFNVQNNTYGVTYNTQLKPVSPVIQVCEGSTFDERTAKEYAISSNDASSYNITGTVYNYFVSKGVMSLSAGKTYTYRVYDKAVKVSSKVATFTTKNSITSKFTFVHLADSQVNGLGSDNVHKVDGTGDFLKRALDSIKSLVLPDFFVHTGDIVEWSKYETYWEKMLSTNSDYFMTVPTMPLSGNHETTYRNGSDEIYKHFNINIPTQSDTTKGFYYYYDYGNVRFIMLNTNRLESGQLTNDQYDWLVSLLKNNNKTWTIVSMHNPMYSVGAYGSNLDKNSVAVKLQAQLSNLFAQNGVDLVLQGHDHVYNKTYPIKAQNVIDTTHEVRVVNGVEYDVNPKGTIYAMNGCTGNQPRSTYSSINRELYAWYCQGRNSSYAEIAIDGNKLTVNVKYVTNDNITYTAKSYGIIKE